jgi:hypothetical protein
MNDIDPSYASRADWNAPSGRLNSILNKPVLGTAASSDATSFATAAQGAKADTALQVQVNADWNASSGAAAILNKPSIAASVALSSTTPAALGTAAIGTGTTAARADHVHQYPVLSLLNQSFTTAAIGLLGSATVVTYTVTGATVGMGVLVNPRTTSSIASLLYGFVSAANTVSVVVNPIVVVGATTLTIDIHVIP